MSKSRAEIDALLRGWGCGQLQWSDDFAAGRVRLRFVWAHSGASYLARFDLLLPTDEVLRKRAGGWDGKLRKLQADRGKQEHRVLLLWLKAALNAVESGLVTAETLFLPFLEGADGQTVAEIAVPRMGFLHSEGAGRLLTDGGR